MAKVLIIAGPTACGKSAYAYKIAKEKKGVILNADSLQVYESLEILTAHPPPHHKKHIPHFLYGFLPLSGVCSAGKWVSLALPIIENAHQQGKLPIVVGGTGLYLKGLLEGFSSIPDVAPSVREQLKNSSDDLYAKLITVDPSLAKRIHPHDHQRILRGLEVFYGTGKPLSFWQAQKPTSPPFDFEKILFMPSMKKLEPRFSERLEYMVKKGVLEEVSRALSCSPSPSALKAIGMREFGAYLKGECSLERAKELTLIHTRQYAKRQRTWFRSTFKANRIMENIFS